MFMGFGADLLKNVLIRAW